MRNAKRTVFTQVYNSVWSKSWGEFDHHTDLRIWQHRIAVRIATLELCNTQEEALNAER